jgi:hypothetical protein
MMSRTFGMLSSQRVSGEQRASARQPLGVTGRVVWKDGRGTTRFNSVVIRDVSDTGAYIENLSGSAIPLFRLVSLQVERAGQSESVPAMLRSGRVLSAVYRVGPSRQSTGVPEGYGLRLLVEPRRRAALVPTPRPVVAFATA